MSENKEIINEDHFEFHELFYDVSVFLKKQIKSKLTVPQELFSAVLTGLSPAERLFILQVYPDIADNIQELAKARLVGDKSRK